jgi:DNA invertase Pin-like site-specific DNA recombinase
MATLGYARVSTDRQSLDQQRDALTAAGVERIFTDKRSGARDDREGLAALIDYAREGDVVVVVALDRLGRSLSGIIRTIETLTTAGVALRSLRESIDTTSAVGHMLIGIFGALAQYERTLINERSAAAREAARARGRHVGRPKALTPDQERQIRALHDAGEAVPALVATFGVSRATVYRLLAENEVPA